MHTHTHARAHVDDCKDDQTTGKDGSSSGYNDTAVTPRPLSVCPNDIHGVRPRKVPDKVTCQPSLLTSRTHSSPGTRQRSTHHKESARSAVFHLSVSGSLLHIYVQAALDCNHSSPFTSVKSSWFAYFAHLPNILPLRGRDGGNW